MSRLIERLNSKKYIAEVIKIGNKKYVLNIKNKHTYNTFHKVYKSKNYALTKMYILTGVKKEGEI